MFQINSEQMQALGQNVRFDKLLRFLQRTLPDFQAFEPDEQRAFVLACIEQADTLRLDSESANASYALGAWWLDMGFEQQSALLQRLFETSLPLARKVSAMNDWIHARLRQPADVTTADQALRQSLSQTHAWGMR